jgi:hypothetical protein
MIGLTPFSFDLAQIAATAYEKHAHIKDICAKDRRSKFVKVSKPIIMHTPSNANNNPILLTNESRSSLNTNDARAKVIIAVVPFRIEANPLSIWVCPHAISEKGMALFKKPITNKTQHCLKFGIGNFNNKTTSQSVKLAQTTRFATIVKTGTSRKINE